MKFDQATFYDSQECLYYIVPIQNNTPHFVVVENITEVKADVWDPNSFCSHISYEPDKLISKNNNISNLGLPNSNFNIIILKINNFKEYFK